MQIQAGAHTHTQSRKDTHNCRRRHTHTQTGEGRCRDMRDTQFCCQVEPTESGRYSLGSILALRPGWYPFWDRVRLQWFFHNWHRGGPVDTTRAGSYELPTSVPRLDFHDTFKAHNSPRKTMMFGGDRCTVQYAVMTASDWLRLCGAHLGVARGHPHRHMEQDVLVAESHSQNKKPPFYGATYKHYLQASDQKPCPPP